MGPSKRLHKGKTYNPNLKSKNVEEVITNYILAQNEICESAHGHACTKLSLQRKIKSSVKWKKKSDNERHYYYVA